MTKGPAPPPPSRPCHEMNLSRGQSSPQVLSRGGPPEEARPSPLRSSLPASAPHSPQLSLSRSTTTPPPPPPRRKKHANTTAGDGFQIRKKARQALKQQLLEDGSLRSNSLYRARRMSVASPSGTMPTLRTPRDMTPASPPTGEEDSLSLRQTLEQTLADEWRRSLFRRFLQQSDEDHLLDFWEAVQRFQEHARQVQQQQATLPEEGFVMARNELREAGRALCHRFVDSALPRPLRTLLKEYCWRLLLPLSLSPGDQETLPMPQSPVLEPTTGSDEEDGDEGEEEWELERPLTSPEMEALHTEDPSLFARKPEVVYSHLQQVTLPPPHLLTVPLGESWVLEWPRQRVYHLLLTETLPHFLHSHNQVQTLARVYAKPSSRVTPLSSRSSSPDGTLAPPLPSSPSSFSEEDTSPTEGDSDVDTELDIVRSTDQSGHQVIDACTVPKCISILITTGTLSEFFLLFFFSLSFLF